MHEHIEITNPLFLKPGVLGFGLDATRDGWAAQVAFSDYETVRIKASSRDLCLAFVARFLRTARLRSLPLAAVARSGVADPRTMTGRVCKCGCGTSLDGRRPRTIYATDACRARVWKRETGYTLTAKRKRDQNASKRRPEARLSYRKLVTALTAEMRHLNVPDPDTRAKLILDPLLTDHQRKALRG